MLQIVKKSFVFGESFRKTSKRHRCPRLTTGNGPEAPLEGAGMLALGSAVVRDPPHERDYGYTST